MIDRLNNSWNFIDEGNGARDVVEDRHLANLFPRIWNIFEQLHDGVRDVFEGAEVHALVVSELTVAHVSVIFNDFSDVFRRQVLQQDEKVSAN